MRISIAVATFLFAAAAFPCSIVVEPHVIEPAEQRIDRTPPDRVVAEVKNIRRGRGPVAHGDGTMAVSSCDDLGSLTIGVTTSDDRTSKENLGYVAIRVDGEVPAGLLENVQAQRIGSGDLTLWWVDGGTDVQEPLEFALSIVAVDLAGNRSAPSEPLWIRHPGSSRESCHDSSAP